MNIIISAYRHGLPVYASFLGEKTLKKKCEYFFREKKSEKREFLPAFSIRREFCARAFRNFTDQKASKTVNFEIEKKEGKIKTYAPVI